jgi:hypothetical protein
MIGATEQRGEAGRSIEARQAYPIDRAIAIDQGRGAHVAQKRVVLDGGWVVVFDAGIHRVAAATKWGQTLFSLPPGTHERKEKSRPSRLHPGVSCA